jgi:hypothetical protein
VVAVSSRLVAVDAVYNDVDEDVDETVKNYLYRNSREGAPARPGRNRA